MKIFKKLGPISTFPIQNKLVDTISFEWFETHKRIAHKKSQNGSTLLIKFLNEDPNFKEGDVLFETETHIGVVVITPCECLIIQPNDHRELAAVCFEIGNRHLPLFMDDNELMLAFDQPLARYFEALGYIIHKDKRKLTKPLKTTVAQHGDNKTLFTKIMQLTQPSS